MKKLVAVVTVVILGAVLLAGCSCKHEWSEATCVLPSTCTKCGETSGEALGHKWEEATCVDAKTCSVCGETEGNPLEHQWEEATCTEAKTCAVCGEHEGGANGHTWEEATCTAPKTCSVCGVIEGEPVPHEVSEWKETQKASCTEEGERLGICTACDVEITETVEKLDHVEGDWVIVEEAIYNSAGKRVKKCKVCGNEVASEEYELSDEEKVASYKKNCSQIAYSEVARNPKNHIFENVKFKGTVIQVMENGDSYNLRVKIGSWKNVLFVKYTKQSPSESRILEDDVITMYGPFTGTVTYETVMGASVTIPSMEALFVDFK